MGLFSLFASMIDLKLANTIPLDCGNTDYERKIHNSTVWRHLQEVYIATNDDPDYAKAWETFPSYQGFQVAFEVRDDGHRGRGVYAAERITKGTQVWSEFHNARFHSANDMMKFLQPLEYELQCDVLMWAYSTPSGHVELALDPASFMNDGESEEVTNLDWNCTAIRDIEIGEELLQDYSSFVGHADWFNVMVGMAWDDAL